MLSKIQKERLNELRLILLQDKKWRYLRYWHLRQGFRLAKGVKTVIAIGAGKGLAELALAVEFPKVHFHITDIKSERTPNYKFALNLAKLWGLPNVTFGTMDILAEPVLAKADLVTSIEVLEHIEDDVRAAKHMCQIASRYVFCLVPFADAKTNATPAKRKRALEQYEHFKIGYDEDLLKSLFGPKQITRGCYWLHKGHLLRQKLNSLTPEEIAAQKKALYKEAANDGLNKIPELYGQAFGVWCLAKV